MIDKIEFREKGYLYDSMENYSELIDVDGYKNWAKRLIGFNLRRHSVREYWYLHKDLSYKEYSYYNDLLKDDDDLNSADYVFKKGHEYQIKKIDECGFYPTWVFGKNQSIEVDSVLKEKNIMEFQKNFIKKYYPEKVGEYEDNFSVQYYDKGCLIDTHDDGRPGKRICVFLFFLNEEWEDSNGGNLLLFENKELTGEGYGGEVDTGDEVPILLKPSYPNFVVLDSEVNLVHEVEKIIKGIRYTAVNFLSNK